MYIDFREWSRHKETTPPLHLIQAAGRLGGEGPMATLAEWEKQYRKGNLSEQEAHASRLPWQSGDGYAYGGGAVVTIGEFSILVGEGDGMFELAQEIARRWNATR
jgi:hypothetical protein